MQDCACVIARQLQTQSPEPHHKCADPLQAEGPLHGSVSSHILQQLDQVTAALRRQGFLNAAIQLSGDEVIVDISRFVLAHGAARSSAASNVMLRPEHRNVAAALSPAAKHLMRYQHAVESCQIFLPSWLTPCMSATEQAPALLYT